jgi:phage terminase large subunit-like protein
LRSALFDYVRRSKATASDVERELSDVEQASLEHLLRDWEVWARDDQLPPRDAAWRTWLILGGRGAGKTRAGAEWVRAQALGLAPFANEPVMRIALVGETYHDARSVMVEGVSGLLAVHARHEQPVFYASRNELIWPNGAIAQLFSAEDPDGLRGPQFGAAWCDEIAKWRHAEDTWDMLQFGLRLGELPRAVVTTTPRANTVLKGLMADETVTVSRARTVDNAANLAGSFLVEMQRRYAGTELGRQELDGELIDELKGTLWQRAWIDEMRCRSMPELSRIVIGVDPPVTTGEKADACGIVIVGRGHDGRGYVLADATVQGLAPNAWARAVLQAYHEFEADRIVAEVNQGGDLVEAVIRQIEPSAPITKVRATRGKWIRAEPIAALYAEERISHVGEFEDLETEMMAFGGDGRASGRSPDRLDALVWALTDLMTTREFVAPRLRRL